MPTDDHDERTRSLGDTIRDAIADAVRRGPRNTAAAININRDGHRVVAYSDDNVTIVQRDGVTEVVRRDDADEDGADGNDADR